ncbi:SspB family protein [Varunaivibrio sulfuroxidans]|uniref:Stringent starvation protein B n=1 Tax=Varunaivibrio sulfuroxidans TaxID=1773489 RepID=A0A4R3J6I0_9PROT|nr:ClpXP protease specificity-enhancing factor SspB [Varunaivibrio sulfuroxidans]TCS60972.1 hypothetical protein EDD55_109133 [Varunaivibrio sulfuroxidans]WES31621.1 ClpXP protease specificity-enhancing factor SspB [Varunaivibrio sulfuroxidans]
MEDDLLRYDRWVEDALRGVIRRGLHFINEHGLPGDHHFYITFRTHAPGVRIPPHLRAQHPEDMTIVLQHQFDGLVVRDDAFEVTLSFGGKPERLTVPFDSVAAFADPSVNFGLQLKIEDDGDDDDLGDGGDDLFIDIDENDNDAATSGAPNDLPFKAAGSKGDKDKPSVGDVSEKDEKSGQVITLDAFRKK